MMRPHAERDLFLISWLILFLELAFIRWFPAHVVFLSFFTNTVLLACFVGMSIGCLTARRQKRHITLTPFLLLVSLVCGVVTDLFAHKLMMLVSAADQSSSSEVIFFGSEVYTGGGQGFYIPAEVIAALFFTLIAVTMIGPGQELGRAFNRVPTRSRAYSMNLLGSLAGILSFAVLSYMERPPSLWFSIAAIGLGYFALRRESDAEPTARFSSNSMVITSLAASVILLLAAPNITAGYNSVKVVTQWSPYYRVDWYPSIGVVDTNRVAHQIMIPRSEPSVARYALPYLFARDVPKADPEHKAWPPFKRILIIGAGSGNDVSRALQWCPDATIDAVEIDPVIQRIGDGHHPDRPYQDKRVTLHINDGRNFLRRAPEHEYDLVIFALVEIGRAHV